ncbi:MAG: type II toxin-antitoxin system HicA family toxin [Vicinamibacterales bacterium]
MKRRDLERHLRAHGATLRKEGGNHSKWISPKGTSAVPRHNEIKPTVVRSICRQLGIPAPHNPN